MEEVREIGLSKVIERIRDRVGNTKAFVTLDIDVVDPAFAPGKDDALRDFHLAKSRYEAALAK